VSSAFYYLNFFGGMIQLWKQVFLIPLLQIKTLIVLEASWLKQYSVYITSSMSWVQTPILPKITKIKNSLNIDRQGLIMALLNLLRSICKMPANVEDCVVGSTTQLTWLLPIMTLKPKKATQWMTKRQLFVFLKLIMKGMQ
jgi:hypothetical protein